VRGFFNRLVGAGTKFVGALHIAVMGGGTEDDDPVEAGPERLHRLAFHFSRTTAQLHRVAFPFLRPWKRASSRLSKRLEGRCHFPRTRHCCVVTPQVQ